MLINDDEILNGCRGRIGDFVVYQHKGKTCLRRLPDKESIRLTPGMVAQQERVAGIGALWRAMKFAGIDRVWNRAAEGTRMSGYTLLVKTDSQAFSGTGHVCDFRKLLLTVGEVQLPDNLTLTRETPEEWVFTWESDGVPYPVAHGDDRLVVALVKQWKGIGIRIPEIGDWRRKEGRAVVRIPEAFESYDHLYCYFCSHAGDEVSKSRYFLI